MKSVLRCVLATYFGYRITGNGNPLAAVTYADSVTQQASYPAWTPHAAPAITTTASFSDTWNSWTALNESHIHDPGHETPDNISSY